MASPGAEFPSFTANDVQIVCMQTSATAREAVEALNNNDGDIVNAIMELSYRSDHPVRPTRLPLGGQTLTEEAAASHTAAVLSRQSSTVVGRTDSVVYVRSDNGQSGRWYMRETDDDNEPTGVLRPLSQPEVQEMEADIYDEMNDSTFRITVHSTARKTSASCSRAS